MTNDLTIVIKSKGWQAKEVAQRWGITPRRMSQIAAAPTQRDWDAVNGLPERKTP